MPGVTYSRQVQFTAHGPVVIHVLVAPKPGGLYALRPILSNGSLLGRGRAPPPGAARAGPRARGGGGGPLRGPGARGRGAAGGAPGRGGSARGRRRPPA